MGNETHTWIKNDTRYLKTWAEFHKFCVVPDFLPVFFVLVSSGWALCQNSANKCIFTSFRLISDGFQTHLNFLFGHNEREYTHPPYGTITKSNVAFSNFRGFGYKGVG